MRRQSKRSDAAPIEKKSMLAPIILTISAVFHLGLLGYAALLPAQPPTVDPNVRVQVMQWQHNDAAQSWAGQGAKWALVSRDKIQAPGQ
jgi:hypothetical protein